MPKQIQSAIPIAFTAALFRQFAVGIALAPLAANITEDGSCGSGCNVAHVVADMWCLHSCYDRANSVAHAMR